MHGLICASFEGFLRAAYGSALWREVVVELDAGFEAFEPMFHYDTDDIARLVDLCADWLGKPREHLLEDFGTHLVAGTPQSRVRRLLRFGGVDYEDFLHSLDDLPGRAALAVPDIGLPDLSLREGTGGALSLLCNSGFDGAGHVVVGLLRALADDYGALALLNHAGRTEAGEVIEIDLLKTDFAEGRGFDLAEAGVALRARVP